MEKNEDSSMYKILLAADKMLDDNGILFFDTVPNMTLERVFKDGVECEWGKYDIATRDSFLDHILVDKDKEADVVVSLSSEFLKSFFGLYNYEEWLRRVKKEKREREIINAVSDSAISPYSTYPPTILAVIPGEFVRGAFVTVGGERCFVENKGFYDNLSDSDKLDFCRDINQHADYNSVLRIRTIVMPEEHN